MSRKDHQRQDLKRLAIGSTIAAAAGYVAGILTAPKSGKETRQDIKHTASEGLAKSEKELKKLHTELGKAIDDAKAKAEQLGSKAKNELQELIKRAKGTKEKTREAISAMHEGDAEDADLKQAVKEAKQALDHLNSYLKK